MSIVQNEHASQQEPLSELTRRALEIYDAKIKMLVEPDQNGRGMAIHPDSGDYLVAPTPTQAGKLLDARYPDEAMVTFTIGPTPDYALAARYLAGRTAVAFRVI